MPSVTSSEPSYHALLIGIDAYPGQNALFACVNDIDAVERMLLDGVGLPRDRVHVHRLAAPHPDHMSAGRRDEAPTKANILRALGSLASADPGDRVLVYYSGHGAQGRVTGLSGWQAMHAPRRGDPRHVAVSRDAPGSVLPEADGSRLTKTSHRRSTSTHNRFVS